MKKKSWTAFLLFLCFMGLCTLITKGIYKSQLARVKLCHAESRYITHALSGVGSALVGQEKGIYTVENLRVSEILVQPGDKVAQGDTLFAVDRQELAEQIQEAEGEIAYLQAQQKDIAAQKKQTKQERERAAARLTEDYVTLIEEQDMQVREAELAAAAALLRMQADAAAAAEAQEKANSASSVSGGDADAAGESRQAKLQAELAKVAYESAVCAVEEAKRKKEEAVRDWNRRVEDAGSETGVESAQSVKLQGEILLLETKLERMRELLAQDGCVYAAEDGFIRGIFVQTGERTGDGACMLYAVSGGCGKVLVPVEESGAYQLSIGDKVQLRYKTAGGESRKVSGIVSYIASENGRKTLRIETEEPSLPPGQTVYMDADMKSKVYDAVLPRSAVFGNATSGYYVYVTEESDGILGTETRLRKIPVLLLEQNESFCAVQSAALSAESAVVSDSSKELKEDCAVRVIEGS